MPTRRFFLSSLFDLICLLALCGEPGYAFCPEDPFDAEARLQTDASTSVQELAVSHPSSMPPSPLEHPLEKPRRFAAAGLLPRYRQTAC
jgi:hypothetical protein